MAKYTEKKLMVDAVQFDASMNQGQWPARVRVNALSATGYSYGTLAESQAPMGPGYIKVDGFPVRNLDYICTGSDGLVYSLSPEEVSRRFDLKGNGFVGFQNTAQVETAQTKRRK